MSERTFESKPGEPEDVEMGDRLSEEGAHEEANRIRAHLETRQQFERKYWDRDSAEWSNPNFDPRENKPEDYDLALKAIEEIKQLAEEEPATTKVLYKFGRILHNVARVPGAAIVVLDRILIKHPTGAYLIGGELKQLDKFLEKGLTDAAKDLEKMKELGRKYAETELKHTGEKPKE